MDPPPMQKRGLPRLRSAERLIWRTQTGLDKTPCMNRTRAVHDHTGALEDGAYGWPGPPKKKNVPQFGSPELFVS
jgi:hypothetical protein